MFGKEWDTISAFLMGLIIGFFFGSIVWSVAVYVFLTIKDWIRKRKEGNFKLGRNMEKGRDPKLILLDDD